MKARNQMFAALAAQWVLLFASMANGGMRSTVNSIPGFGLEPATGWGRSR